ncbi:response regulator transcription factor [Haliscomenobacter hydrossis]|uniref:Two component transcriptional regulator, LuxR family n=1 Tax=Haliscomenobacter hydrossis (strain ATCC 27775 / DSM 1100 / LMG 10767 / O) TaxID=760192 RepID=F4KSD0_HALH1|nr:response regulator transcription factor [Haliscomenobacter hydrossis]AEE53333.1 two component transcriptional regulator, LuxR family [Haliscomenobacter hydrossis DSM 1100]
MSTELKKIRVIVVEDEDQTRDLLSVIFSRDKQIELLASFNNAEDAVVNILEHQPDVVIMDIGLPEMSGIAGMVKIKEIFPNMYFIMYTIFEDQSLIDAIVAGADGYILKRESTDALVDAIKTILDGGLVMSSYITRKAMEYFIQKRKQFKQNYSSEEIKLMKALAEGFGNKRIADQEKTTEGAIKQRLYKLFKKAQAKNRAEMVKIYLENIE